MPISWQMMLSTSAMRARREAPPPDGVGDARDDAEGGRVGRGSGRVVLRRADGLPADACCRQQVGERASRDAPEPCTDDGTPRASREACEAAREVRWGTLACDLSVFIHFARTRGVVRTCCSENQTSRTQRARPLRSRARTGHHQKHRPPMAVPVDARAASGMGLGPLALRTLATPWAQAPPFSHRRRSFRPRRTRT